MTMSGRISEFFAGMLGVGVGMFGSEMVINHYNLRKFSVYVDRVEREADILYAVTYVDGKEVTRKEIGKAHS